MKGRIFATLFALPFAGVGLWMLISIGATFHDALRMQDWVPVDAMLVRAGYETSSGENTDTYKAFAEYTYEYGARRYRGDRAMIAGGGDNIGDFQRRLGQRLRQALQNGGHITVYVDPDAPSDSVVDRTLRWGLVGFKAIFVLLFGGIGFGLIFLAWRAPVEKDRALPIYREQPWLLNEAWQTPEIRSGSRAAMHGAWFFAGVWNLVSAPLPFLLYEEVIDKGNTLALLGLVFPLVGIGLMAWAIRRTLEWRRFGGAPVVLDPFPGSIGGHVGGTVDLALPFDPSRRFSLTLSNIHSYESGSGDDRSQNEKSAWQDTVVAHAEPGPKGTRLSFRFEVPEGLHESETDKDDSYYLWRLSLEADLPGTDLDRSYEIPVYATGERSALLSDRAVKRSRAAQDLVDDGAVRRLVDIRHGPTGRSLYYGMGRNAGPSLGGLLTGLMFAGAGWWLVTAEDAIFFGGVFLLVGGSIAAATLYMLLNSLEIRQQGPDLVTIRRLLGIPVRRRTIRRHDFSRFTMDSSFQARSGSKHVMFYRLLAEDRSGAKIVVGDGFRGENQARAAIRLLTKELGLAERDPRPGNDPDGLFGPEVLT